MRSNSNSMLLSQLARQLSNDTTSSIRSTVTIREDGKNSQQQLNLPSHNKKSKKQVRFDCTRNTIVVVASQQQQLQPLVQDLWYSAAELSAFKSEYFQSARQVARLEATNASPTSYGHVLERLYQACKSLATTATTNDEDARLKDLLSEKDREQLCYWTEIATSRHGVEVASTKMIELDRLRRRGALMSRAKRIQEDFGNCLDEEAEAQLQVLSARLSKPSRLFARALAEASSSSLCNNQTAATVPIVPCSVSLKNSATTTATQVLLEDRPFWTRFWHGFNSS